MRSAISIASLALMLTACGSDWRFRDLDGDGLTPADGDCWDQAEGPEGSNLSGLDIGPHAQETWYDGFDQDCAGDDDYDADGDGWVSEAEYYLQETLGVPDSGEHLGYGDCWDAPQDTIIPVEFVGVDGSIFTPAEINPGAEDSWYDGIDQDCMSDDDFDQDVDGYASADHENRDGETGEDCADTDESINPDAEEICDELDNDCDGLTDIEDDSVNLEDLPTWYVDADSDGFGDPALGTVTCERPDGYVEEELATDCDDADAEIHPDGDEICDEIDNDCDGLIDDEDDDLVEDSGEAFYADDDGDGYGDADNITMACEQPSGYTTDTTDCDDADAQIHPGADELCATVGIDDDCDGEVDEDDAIDTDTYYADGDGDGYGDAEEATQTCTPPSGYISDATDCDDADAAVNPAATEVCDDIDNDCDGDIDDDDSDLDASTASTWYADTDGDGHGDSAEMTQACEQPDDYVSDDTDCDDADADISPSATEICDEQDNDCDGAVDDDDSDLDTSTADTWYADGDSDGFGDADSATVACEQPSGYIADDTDCDDSEIAINPDAEEICDGLDNDCDGDVDDDDVSLDISTTTTFYADGDGDGYGTSEKTDEACELPSGAVENAEDCDDGDAAINPDATEVCDGVDNDCDEDVDDEDSDLDSSTGELFYVDSDGDGYGSSSSTTRACEEPSGFSDSSDDCDDDEADVNPGEDEICNDGLDNDCDGSLELTEYGGSCELVDLGLNDANVIFAGSNSQDVAGSQVALLPDIDGDGVADLAIAAPYEDEGGSGSGTVYLYTGLDSLDWDSQESWDLDSTSPYSFYGEANSDHAGHGVGGGDFDGDGYGDLLITSPHNDDAATGAGKGYIFYGPLTGSDQLSLSSADSSYEGYDAGDYAGWSTSMRGDVDGDGCSDIMVGAPQDPVANSSSGSVAGEGYVILIPGASSSSSCGGSGSLILYYGEEDGDAAGYSLGFVDTDGDGESEVLIGAPQADIGAGSKSGAVYLSDAQETSFFVALGDGMVTFAGESINDRAGWSVSGSGDTNGDGYEDILIGAWQDDDGANNAGAVYLVLGPVSISGSDFDLAGADAKLTGSTAGDGAGYAVDFGGQLNEDEFDDILVGAWKQDDGGTDAGSTYVLLGPVTGSISLSDADAVLSGDSSSDQSGTFVQGGEDVNGDGFDDILIGARYADDGGTNSGAAYLVLGLGQ